MNLQNLSWSDLASIVGIITGTVVFLYKVISYVIRAETKDLASRDDLLEFEERLGDNLNEKLEGQNRLIMARIDQRLSDHLVELTQVEDLDEDDELDYEIRGVTRGKNN